MAWADLRAEIDAEFDQLSRRSDEITRALEERYQKRLKYLREWQREYRHRRRNDREWRDHCNALWRAYYKRRGQNVRAAKRERDRKRSKARDPEYYRRRRADPAWQAKQNQKIAALSPQALAEIRARKAATQRRVAARRKLRMGIDAWRAWKAAKRRAERQRRRQRLATAS